MTEPKFCKDCAHFRAALHREAPWTPGTPLKERCMHPDNLGRNLVTGSEFTKAAPFELRSYTAGSCGKDGNWFEAKPPQQVVHEEVTRQMIDASLLTSRVPKPWPFPEPTPRWKAWLYRVMGL